MKARITTDLEPITELTDWDFPDTKSIRKGYDWETVPDISAGNIKVLMDKMNEVIKRLNALTDDEDGPSS